MNGGNVEKLFSYAMIATGEDMTRILETDPVGLCERMANAQNALRNVRQRRGPIEIMFRNRPGELFGWFIEWRPYRVRIAAEWFDVASGVRVATATIPLVETGRGDIAELTDWREKLRWVNEWTAPGWFRCHGCGRRFRRDECGVAADMENIFCPECWTTTKNEWGTK